MTAAAIIQSLDITVDVFYFKYFYSGFLFVPKNCDNIYLHTVISTNQWYVSNKLVSE